MTVGIDIGEHKLSYDLWAETVDDPIRLASAGSSRCVHASSHVAGRLRDWFQLESCRLIELKGIDSVETYSLHAL